MVVSLSALILVWYVTIDVELSHATVKQNDPCTKVILMFNTTSTRGNMIHHFRLRSTGMLFVARNDCRTETIKWEANVEKVGISVELNFLQKQWSELTRLFSRSPVWNKRITLIYVFDASSRSCEFSFYIDSSLASVSKDGVATIDHRHIKDVKGHANGIGINLLKKDASQLYTKWKAYCERVEINKSRTTRSPHTPVFTEHVTTILTTPVVISTLQISNVNVYFSNGSVDALTTGETGSIIAVIVLVILIAPVSFMVWRWRGPLKTKFERVSTW